MKDEAKLVRAAVLREVCLHCSDIPEVQHHIRLLEVATVELFEENAESALSLLALDLDDLAAEESEEDAAFLVLGLWLATVDALGRGDLDLSEVVRLSGRALVAGGANAATAEATAAGLLREFAGPSERDLLFWFGQAAATNPQIEESFKAAVMGWWRRGDFSTAARLNLLSNVRGILLRGRHVLRLTVDTWAYRWFNVGLFEGLVATLPVGQVIVAFNNPPGGPDSRTTPFCVWVHGRVLEVKRVRRQLQTYINAIALGRTADAKEAWPLLTGPQANGDGVRFEEVMPRIGIPPYHFRCRTIIRTAVSAG